MVMRKEGVERRKGVEGKGAGRRDEGRLSLVLKEGRGSGGGG